MEEIVLAVTTAVIGASLVAAGIRGYLFGLLNLIQRIVLFAGGLFLIAPDITFPLIGLGISFAALIPNLWVLRNIKNEMKSNSK